MDKYLNEAIVGNGKVTATLSKTGELLRFFYPQPDFKQFVEWLRIGVKINDSLNISLHDDINNTYMQRYIENTNVLQTEIFNTYFDLRILQTDFVPINENVLIRNYLIKNESSSKLKVNVLVDSNLLTNINNDTAGLMKYDSLIQYNHDYTMCLFANKNIDSYQINNVQNNIWTGNISGKDYVGLSSNSAISYDIGELSPNSEARFSLFVFVNDNRFIKFNDLGHKIESLKKIDVNESFSKTLEFWKQYVDEHDKLGIQNLNLDEKIKEIYIRTILLYPLLQNNETGGMSAGIEVDEYKTRCGRYSYCWPRDALFITKAQDILGMIDETTAFYSDFCRMTQDKDGKWEQRFYTDGRLAPSWGYQIDETASVVIGLYHHYLVVNDINFLIKNMTMINRAIDYLKLYTDDVLSKEFKLQRSYDLWEEYEGITLYGLTSIYEAFKAAIKLNIVLAVSGKENQILDEYCLKLKQFILENFFNVDNKTLMRNLEDFRMDISMLGPSVPFSMLEADSREIANTVQKMEMTLRTYTGGFLRYENDNYIGGNPWIVATLWMALYYIEVDEKKKALDCFDFVLKTACEHGFLAEQIDNVSLKGKWVIGLSWSHAMFILVLQKLLEKGML